MPTPARARAHFGAPWRRRATVRPQLFPAAAGPAVPAPSQTAAPVSPATRSQCDEVRDDRYYLPPVRADVVPRIAAQQQGFGLPSASMQPRGTGRARSGASPSPPFAVRALNLVDLHLAATSLCAGLRTRSAGGENACEATVGAAASLAGVSGF